MQIIVHACACKDEAKLVNVIDDPSNHSKLFVNGLRLNPIQTWLVVNGLAYWFIKSFRKFCSALDVILTKLAPFYREAKYNR